VSGEDCTTIGEGGSTGIKPGLNAITVPILTALVVICVVALCVMPEWSTTEVYATGCANAKGVIIAPTRTIIIRLMGVPFVESIFPYLFSQGALSLDASDNLKIAFVMSCRCAVTKGSTAA
jgi:hypothetical protein